MAFQTNFYKNQIFGWVIRISQLVFTIVSLGLIGRVLDKYSTGGVSGFGMFTAVFTLVYLIVAFAFTFFKPSLFIIGSLLILDSFTALIWFITFIAFAATFGGDNCNYSFRYYYYIYSVDSSGCNSSKAVIAFGVLNFLLFTASSVILGVGATKEILGSNDKALWQTSGASGYLLNKPFLALASYPAISRTTGDIEESVDTAPAVTEEKVEEDDIVPPVAPEAAVVNQPANTVEPTR